MSTMMIDYTSSVPTMQEIGAFILEAQQLLGLTDWEVSVATGASKGFWAQIDIKLHYYKIAVMQIGAEFLLRADWQEVVLHELLHLASAPYHVHLMDALPGKKYLPQRRLAGNAEEAVIQTAAHALWRVMCPTTDEPDNQPETAPENEDSDDGNEGTALPRSGGDRPRGTDGNRSRRGYRRLAPR